MLICIQYYLVIFLSIHQEITADEENVRKASLYLSDVVLPNFIQDLCTLEISPMDGQTLTDALHAHGINVRYIGKVSVSYWWVLFNLYWILAHKHIVGKINIFYSLNLKPYCENICLSLSLSNLLLACLNRFSRWPRDPNTCLIYGIFVLTRLLLGLRSTSSRWTFCSTSLVKLSII